MPNIKTFNMSNLEIIHYCFSNTYESDKYYIEQIVEQSYSHYGNCECGNKHTFKNPPDYKFAFSTRMNERTITFTFKKCAKCDKHTFYVTCTENTDGYFYSVTLKLK